MGRKRKPIPRELREGRKQLDAWRRHRQTRAMPAPLWSLAARLGPAHGVSPTARALGLRYDALEARVSALEPEAGAARPKFVELRAAQPTPACRVEVEDGLGARMRIEFTTDPSPTLEVLCRHFLGRRR